MPINRPACPYLTLDNRDDAMRHRVTKVPVNYWPNRYEANPLALESQGGFASYPEKQQSKKARQLSSKFKEHYNQAQVFHNSLSEIEKMHVAKAFSFELDLCDDAIVYKRMSERLAFIDLSLSQTFAKNVGGDKRTKALKENRGLKAKGLSQMEFLPDNPTIATRRVSILLADGFDYAAYTTMKDSLQKRKAFIFTIGSQRQGVKVKSGETVIPDDHFSRMRSSLYNAIFIPGGRQHIAALH